MGQFTTVLALYDPFRVDVPLNFDIIIIYLDLLVIRSFTVISNFVSQECLFRKPCCNDVSTLCIYRWLRMWVHMVCSMVSRLHMAGWSLCFTWQVDHCASHGRLIKAGKSITLSSLGGIIVIGLTQSTCIMGFLFIKTAQQSTLKSFWWLTQRNRRSLSAMQSCCCCML